jgi:voltage-gated potassium channel
MRSFLKISLALLVIVFIGVIGFSYIENWSFLDALYMTAITLTTTGFKEVHTLSSEGRIFTMVLLFIGVVFIAFIVTSISQFIIEGEFRKFFGRKRLDKILKNLKNHVIVCGYGNMGSSVVKGFLNKKTSFVVIEKENVICEKLADLGVPYVHGDSKESEVLLKAGIKKAKNLVLVMDDATNLFVTITAKSLNKNIHIVTKVSKDNMKDKFKMVGANKVVAPYDLTGNRIVRSILNPTIDAFYEITSKNTSLEFQIAELEINKDSKLKNKALVDSRIRSRGVIVIGIKKNTGELLFPPEPDTVLEEDDIVLAIGSKDGIDKVAKDINFS